MRPGERRVALGILLVALVVAGAAVFLTTRENPLARVVAWSRGARFHGRESGVMQVSANDCGPAALAHGLRVLGADVSYPGGGLPRPVDSRGVRFRVLVEEARHRGFPATLRLADPMQPEQVRAPAILWLRSGHFVVLEQVDRAGRAVVFDPALGRLSYSPASLRRHWRGHVMEFPEPERSSHP